MIALASLRCKARSMTRKSKNNHRVSSTGRHSIVSAAIPYNITDQTDKAQMDRTNTLHRQIHTNSWEFSHASFNKWYKKDPKISMNIKDGQYFYTNSAKPMDIGRTLFSTTAG